MKLHELREAKAKKVAELRSILSAANGADLQDQAKARFDALEKECRDLDSHTERETRVAEFERQAAATPVNNGASDSFERECRSYSLLRAVGAAIGIQGVDAGREREVSQEIARRNGRNPNGIFAPLEVLQVPDRRNVEQRVVVSATSGAGAVFTEHHPEQLVDALRAASILERLGATTLRGLVGNFSAPAIDTGATAEWIADNGAITPADMDLNARTMAPKHVGTIVEFSRNMVLQSSPDVETLARNDFARALASAFDAAGLVGGGANQPAGIAATVTPTTFATPTWAEGLAMIASIATANALGGSLGWAGHPQVSKKLRSTLVAAGTDSRMIMSEPNSLYGYQYLDSTALVGNGSPSDRGIIFGNFADLLIGIWSGIDILVNPYAATPFSKGNVQIRGLMSADVVLRHEESFAYASDMNTN